MKGPVIPFGLQPGASSNTRNLADSPSTETESISDNSRAQKAEPAGGIEHSIY